jgi:membrane-associated phospholipid phosphatase
VASLGFAASDAHPAAFTSTPLPAEADAASSRPVRERLLDDLHYSSDNMLEDVEDVVKSPLRVPETVAPGGLLRRRSTYLTLLGAGALFGATFALDQSMRAHVGHMPSGTANNLQEFGQFPVYGSAIVLYGYGLAEDDSRARRFALTDAEGVGVAAVLTVALKPAFGRRRPREHSGHADFFGGGTSFPSGHATPVFAAAAGVSEYFDNAWYASIPVYAAATAVGFGRIGHDAHWLSDIAASAVFGVGTTELLLYLHRRHEEDPAGRWHIFPTTDGQGGGMGVAFVW